MDMLHISMVCRVQSCLCFTTFLSVHMPWHACIYMAAQFELLHRMCNIIAERNKALNLDDRVHILSSICIMFVCLSPTIGVSKCQWNAIDVALPFKDGATVPFG